MIMRVAGAPHGAVLQTLSVPGITLTEAAYSAQSQLSRHTHDCASICMVLDGVLHERLDHQRYDVGRYDILFKSRNTEHADTFGPNGARMLVAELDATWLSSHDSRGLVAEASVCLVGAVAADLTQRLYGELLRLDEGTPLAVQSLCLEILVNVIRTSAFAEQRRLPPWLRRAREILHDGYTEQLSLDELAKQVGVHPVHLAQVFRKSFGVTIGDYTRRLRVRRGSHALLSTHQSIAEIAMDCGFCDQSHFSRVFKRITAATPAEYRRSAGLAAIELAPDGPMQ
jgi:AraC family transcriptional regulator